MFLIRFSVESKCSFVTVKFATSRVVEATADCKKPHATFANLAAILVCFNNLAVFCHFSDFLCMGSTMSNE